MRDLHLREVAVSYRSRTVLSAVTFESAGGEITALVGPNGSGKSSLLRAIAGLVRAPGFARLGDEELFSMPPSRRARRIAFLPQDAAGEGALLALEAVIAAIRVVAPDLKGGDVQRRAMAALARLGMADLAFEPLPHLSGGQRQLAAIAQIVAQQAPLVLLDEPTSALDLRSQLEVMTIVREMAREGAAVLIVLHDLELAARWADRIVVLDRGRMHRPADTPAAAITPAMLADVYGVAARVDADGAGRLRIVAERPLGQAAQPLWSNSHS